MNYYINIANLKVLLLIIAMLPVSRLCAQYTGDSYASAKSKGTAEWVFTYTEAPGFSSHKTGKYEGITFDLMQKFKDYVEKNKGIKINVTVKVTNPNDFPLFLDEVKKSKGGVFGLGNTTITDARKQVYNFSPPYITNIGMILTHSSVPTMNNIADISRIFEGMTAVTIKNSTNEKRIQEIKEKYYPGLKVEYVPSFGTGMKVILQDPNKFVNADFTYYFDAMKNRDPIKRHPGGDENTEEFGIIMPKSNDWAPLLEEFMNSGFVGSIDYKKIIADNLGQGATKFFESINK